MFAAIKEKLSKLLGEPISNSDRTPENAFYRKLISIEDFRKSFSKYERIYFIGGFKYTDANFLKFENAMNVNALSEFLSETKYDATADNIELYYIEEDAQKHYLLMLLDTVELFAKEKILRIIESPIINLTSIKSELIFQGYKA